jgi:hypothetical protein
MDHSDAIATRGAVDDSGNFVNVLNFADSRATPGMFGSGYLELLAREITADLRAIESTPQPGQSVALVSKGIGFGTLARRPSGSWDATAVTGLPPQALSSTGASNPPSLILQPWHHVGNVVSIRQFTANAFNHHHGMQAEERFGAGSDQDGDGFVNELTRADITAATLFQAAMAVPGRVIPDDPALQSAILNGEALFAKIGCASCHVPSLPLNNWMYTEPNPYTPAGNLRLGDAPPLTMDLDGPTLAPSSSDTSQWSRQRPCLHRLQAARYLQRPERSQWRGHQSESGNRLFRVLLGKPIFLDQAPVERRFQSESFSPQEVHHDARINPGSRGRGAIEPEQF